MDVQELMRRAKDGDDDAFDEFVRLTLPGAYRFVRSLGAGEADAEDAVQQAYVRAWRALSRFDTERPVMPWLYQIAKRAFFDLARGRRPLSLSEAIGGEEVLSGTLVDPEPLSDEVFEREEDATYVRIALSELSAQERSVMALRYDEEFSFEEIAQSLEMPAGTIRSIHHRALAKLRTMLADML